MEQRSKGRSRPIPDASKIKKAACKLEEALASEVHYNFSYERKPWEVSMIARDGAVHVLRFLKVWFEVPQTVFFSAVYYLDQFLARMKVQERFLPCLTVSCFNVAAERHGFKINASQMVMLSQSKCSVKDMQRMSTIIVEKLNLGNVNDDRTALDLLTVYLDIFRCIAVQFKSEVLLNTILKQEQLCTRLEVLISDSSCVCYNPSVLSLAFIQYEMERFLSKEIPYKSNYYSMEMFYLLAVMIELQCLCKVNAADYASCYESIANVLKEYDGMKKARHCQKLAWRFSTSTLALSNRSQSSYSNLNTVDEE